MENTDKTSRSIFVGNIPYEATEEKLMALFNQAGPVIGFRLVYDRESGKPKGYGFCEYNSTAIAASALRNLNNIEYNGRPLRIGPAAGEQNSAEVAMTNNTTMKPPQESPYGERVDPAQAGVVISQAVASLPPEQLYELMTQMKQCIQNNPNEARQLLLQNPQLTYALLQAQITMKIIEPKVAIAMMTRSNEQIPLTSIEQNHIAPPMVNQGPPLPMFMGQSYPPNVDQNHHQQQIQIPIPQMQPPMSLPSQMPPHFNNFPPGIIPNFNPPMFPQQTPPIDLIPIKDIKAEASSQSKEAIDMMQYFDSHGEKNKATLIMQVLSLTDEQVSKLPEDQRKSIEVLKNQLKKN